MSLPSCNSCQSILLILCFKMTHTPCGGGMVLAQFPTSELKDASFPLLGQCRLVWAQGSVLLWELPSIESCFLILNYTSTFNHWPTRGRYKIPVPSPRFKTTLKGHPSLELPMVLAEGSASQFNFSLYSGLMPSFPHKCISLEHYSMNLLCTNLYLTT